MSSTRSSESAFRSSTNEASGLTSSSSTPSCSTTIFLSRSYVVATDSLLGADRPVRRRVDPLRSAQHAVHQASRRVSTVGPRQLDPLGDRHPGRRRPECSTSPMAQRRSARSIRASWTTGYWGATARSGRRSRPVARRRSRRAAERARRSPDRPRSRPAAARGSPRPSAGRTRPRRPRRGPGDDRRERSARPGGRAAPGPPRSGADAVDDDDDLAHLEPEQPLDGRADGGPDLAGERDEGVARSGDDRQSDVDPPTVDPADDGRPARAARRRTRTARPGRRPGPPWRPAGPSRRRPTGRRSGRRKGSSLRLRRRRLRHADRSIRVAGQLVDRGTRGGSGRRRVGRIGSARPGTSRRSARGSGPVPRRRRRRRRSRPSAASPDRG